MGQLIYIDTNVYMDHFGGRVDKLRPLGEFAFEVFRRTICCEFTIAVSSLVLEELFYNSYENPTNELLSGLESKGKIVRVEITQEDVYTARRIVRERRTHFNDTLHAVIAHKVKAECVVTRNVKDFLELKDLVAVLLPEHL